MTELTWEGMHYGTALEDRSYAKGVEKGRFLEGGYLITLLVAELTKVKQTKFTDTNAKSIIHSMESLETAIRVLENRCEELRRRNGWE